jgi:lysophospholipase L1-like esterase
MQPFIMGWVARQHPDVVLLQVGTNDLITGTSAAATAQRLDSMLTTIRAAASHAHVIVAGVWAPLPAHALARAQFSRLAWDVVSRHQAAGQTTTFIDTSKLLTSTDLFDGVHPNAVGYRKIARIWERAIRSYLIARELTRRRALSSVSAVANLRPSSPIAAPARR